MSINHDSTVIKSDGIETQERIQFQVDFFLSSEINPPQSCYLRLTFAREGLPIECNLHMNQIRFVRYPG